MYITYLEIIRKCFIDEWGTLFGICEEQHFRSLDILLDESFVIICSNFNRFILIIFACRFLQLFNVEFLGIYVRGWNRMSGVNTNSWEFSDLFFITNLSEFTAINWADSEDTFVLSGKAIVILYNVLRFSIYRWEIMVNRFAFIWWSLLTWIFVKMNNWDTLVPVFANLFFEVELGVIYYVGVDCIINLFWKSATKKSGYSKSFSKHVFV